MQRRHCSRLGRDTHLIQILRCAVLGVIVPVQLSIVFGRIRTGPLIAVATGSHISPVRTKFVIEPVGLFELVVDVTLPRNAVLQHTERNPFCVQRSRPEFDDIVKERVRHQTTRIQLDASEKVERVAQLRGKTVLSDGTSKLIVVAAPRVLTVVLIEVLDFVIHQDRGLHVLLGSEGDTARCLGVGCGVNTAIWVWVIVRVVLDLELLYRI